MDWNPILKRLHCDQWNFFHKHHCSVIAALTQTNSDVWCKRALKAQKGYLWITHQTETFPITKPSSCLHRLRNKLSIIRIHSLGRKMGGSLTSLHCGVETVRIPYQSNMKDEGLRSQLTTLSGEEASTRPSPPPPAPVNKRKIMLKTLSSLILCKWSITTKVTHILSYVDSIVSLGRSLSSFLFLKKKRRVANNNVFGKALKSAEIYKYECKLKQLFFIKYKTEKRTILKGGKDQRTMQKRPKNNLQTLKKHFLFVRSKR